MWIYLMVNECGSTTNEAWPNGTTYVVYHICGVLGFKVLSHSHCFISVLAIEGRKRTSSRSSKRP